MADLFCMVDQIYWKQSQYINLCIILTFLFPLAICLLQLFFSILNCVWEPDKIRIIHRAPGHPGLCCWPLHPSAGGSHSLLGDAIAPKKFWTIKVQQTNATQYMTERTHIPIHPCSVSGVYCRDCKCRKCPCLLASLSCWLLPTASNPIPSTDTALSHRMPGALERCEDLKMLAFTKITFSFLQHRRLQLPTKEKKSLPVALSSSGRSSLRYDVTVLILTQVNTTVFHSAQHISVPRPWQSIVLEFKLTSSLGG